MRRQTNALLLNFSKAFDSVPHQRLLIKLNSWLWCLGWYAYVDLRFFLKSLSSSLHIQLFRERLSGKVHATILKGIVGGFEFFFFKEIWKNWHERPWKCVGERQRKTTKVGSTATVVGNSVLIISHVTFRGCHVHIFSNNLSRNSCIVFAPLPSLSCREFRRVQF